MRMTMNKSYLANYVSPFEDAQSNGIHSFC